MKTSTTEVSNTEATVTYNNAPAIYVYDSANKECGILNLHSTVEPYWDRMDGEFFKTREASLQMETQKKGTVLFKMNNSGKRVNLAWVNGNKAGKAAFIKAFGKEEFFFASPHSEADVFGD